MMKVAIVITSLEVGGAERTVIETARMIHNKCALKVFVISRNCDSIYDRAAERSGLDIAYMGNPLPVFNPFTFMKLRKELDRFRPDIIHSHLKAADYVYFYRLFKPRTFTWLHTVHTIPRVDCSFIRRLFYRPLYNNKTVKLIAVSAAIKSALEKLYPRAAVTVINNGVDTSIFKCEPIHHPGITICHVGRFAPVKNHGYLVSEFRKVVKTHPEVKLLLIGSGRRKKRMLRYIRRHRLEENVRLIDCTAAVDRYLKEADIFVLPSAYEGFPLALLEAMACGLIVITSDWGKGIITPGKNGFVIENKPGQLAGKILAVIENLDKLDAVRMAAVETTQNFSLEKTAARILDLYAGVSNDQIGDDNRMS